MKKILFLACFCLAYDAHSQHMPPLFSGDSIIGGDTFAIRQTFCATGCTGITDTILTEELWCNGVMLDVEKDKGKPATNMHILSISHVMFRGQSTLLVESTTVLSGNYKTYFTKTDPCTYARITL